MEDRMIQMLTMIAEQIQGKKDLIDREGAIMQSLLNKGFDIEEVDAALTLMQVLVQKRSEDFVAPKDKRRQAAVRAMNRQERMRFTPEAFSFVSRLAHLGIISDEQRDDILEKVMANYEGRIDLPGVKTIIAFMLFSGDLGGEILADFDGNHRGSAYWN